MKYGLFVKRLEKSGNFIHLGVMFNEDGKMNSEISEKYVNGWNSKKRRVKLSRAGYLKENKSLYV